MIKMISDIKVPREAGGAEERGEVSPGGCPPGGDPGRIDPVFRSMSAQPAHGGFAIMELGRKSRLVAQPVADTGDGIASLRKVAHRAGIFVTAFPTSAVDPHDRRHRSLGVIRQVKIQRLLRADSYEIGNVRNDSHERGKSVRNGEAGRPALL